MNCITGIALSLIEEVDCSLENLVNESEFHHTLFCGSLIVSIFEPASIALEWLVEFHILSSAVKNLERMCWHLIGHWNLGHFAGDCVAESHRQEA